MGVRGRKIWWLYICLVAAAIVGAWQLLRTPIDEAAQKRISIEEVGQIESITLQRGESLLKLEQVGNNVWCVNQTQPAASNVISSLIEILQAITVELPTEGIDSGELSKAFQERGIGVRLTRKKGGETEYAIAQWDDNLAILRFPDQPQLFTVSLPGYSPDLFANLSLDASRWVSMRLGIEKPSEIKGIQVVWERDTAAGFYLEVDESLRATLHPNAATHSTLRYDTTNVSALLHAFTNLTHTPASDTITAATHKALQGQSPYLCITLTRRVGTPLTYELFHIHSSTDYTEEFDRNYSLLRNGDKIYVIALSDWDAAMPSRQNLLAKH